MSSKAGFSVRDVTPGGPVFLAGYPSRREPSDGVEDPLFLRVMALEDGDGKRAVFVTADLLKFPKDMAWRTKRWAEEELRLPSSAMVINLSHTHCAPALFYQECYPHWALDTAYVRDLEVNIRDAIREAIADLAPTRIRYGLHQAHFGVSRRAPNPELPGKVRLGMNPDGYYDPDFSILTFQRPDDDALTAVFYSYGCHPTSKGGNLVSADYPGEISRALKQHFGQDCHTLFAQGAGASISTRYGYRTEEQKAAYSANWQREAEAIAAFIEGCGVRDLELSLTSNEHEFSIPYDMDEAPSDAELMQYADPAEPPVQRFISPANREILRLWAAGIIEKKRDGALPDGFGMHTTRLRLSDDLQVIGLSGEVTADVGRMIKDDQGGLDTIFLGYCSYTDAYIPTAAMLPEEGHEGLYSIYFHMRPAPFVKEIDEILLRELKKTE